MSEIQLRSRIQTWRRHLRAAGFALWIPRSPADQATYGPYAILDATSRTLVASGVDDPDAWLQDWKVQEVVNAAPELSPAKAEEIVRILKGGGAR